MNIRIFSTTYPVLQRSHYYIANHYYIITLSIIVTKIPGCFGHALLLRSPLVCCCKTALKDCLIVAVVTTPYKKS